MKVVLDTHTWLWFVNDPSMLSDTAAEAIEQSKKENQILISSISVWEVALLCKKGRLQLTESPDGWIRKNEKLPFLNFVPMSNQIAIKSVALPLPLKDPADRIIIATAMINDAKLVTKDETITRYYDIGIIW